MSPDDKAAAKLAGAAFIAGMGVRGMLPDALGNAIIFIGVGIMMFDIWLRWEKTK